MILSSSLINRQYPTMTTTAPSIMATLAAMVRRDTPEVLLIDSKAPPSPTAFNPSVLTQGPWTTQITGLPTAIAPPSSTSSSATSDTDPGRLSQGASISLILLLSLSVAVIIFIVSFVLISRRRRAGRPGLPRLKWPFFSLFGPSRKGIRWHSRTKRSDNRTSLLPSDRLAVGAELGYRGMAPPPGNGHRVGQGQPAVATWTHPPPAELDGQGIGDPPIGPDWVLRMSSFLATGRPKGHRRMESSLRATRSIRESFGEKVNDPGVAVLIQEPKNTLSRDSRTSRAICEKALPEIPESLTEETSVLIRPRLASPGTRRNWERADRASSRNTFGSLRGGSGMANGSARSLPPPVPDNTTRRIEEAEIVVGFTEVRTLGR